MSEDSNVRTKGISSTRAGMTSDHRDMATDTKASVKFEKGDTDERLVLMRSFPFL